MTSNFSRRMKSISLPIIVLPVWERLENLRRLSPGDRTDLSVGARYLSVSFQQSGSDVSVFGVIDFRHGRLCAVRSPEQDAVPGFCRPLNCDYCWCGLGHE